jgi:hypothetical protein
VPSEKLCVVATQAGLSPPAQRANVAAWCDILPTLHGVRFLWLGSRVPQALFEAVCRMSALEGLYIKWSGITDLAAIARCTRLRYFHLGQSAQVSSIQDLRHVQLRWLGLELLAKVRDLSPIACMTQLEGLSLEGSMSTRWSVENLRPLRGLDGLRYLSIANLTAEDRSLAPLFSLTHLETFHHGTWWPATELSEIHRRNKALRA